MREIEIALQGFLGEFHTINDTLAMRREDFTAVHVNNILEAYEYLNGLLARGMDLFTPAGLHSLLEMNHLVLCGSDRSTRNQYYQHIVETRNSFNKRIKPVRDWVLSKNGSHNPYKLAAGFYSRSLSQPQLFIEGNHRTGNILLNYLLISRGASPYVIDATTARGYLDLSTEIKYTNKEEALNHSLKMPGHRKRFEEFLRVASCDRFLQKG